MRYINTIESHKRVKKVIRPMYAFLTSKWFLRTILLLAALQGIWYALSFSPSIFDEEQHLGIARLYSERWNPFISDQLTKWDVLGEVTRNGSYLYYYIMGLFLRLASIFTDSTITQVIFLRLINVSFFVAGLYIFDLFFRKIKANVIASRLALLLIILTPSIAILPGAVNYDNLMFLCLAVFSLFVAISLKQRYITARQVLLFTILVCLSSIVKWQFIAFALPASVFMIYDIVRNKKYQKLTFRSFYPKNWKQTILIIATLVSVGLFIERPVYNYIKYNNVTVACKKIHEIERCKANYTEKRNIEGPEKRPIGFIPQPITKYTMNEWINGMMTTQTRIIPNDPSLPLMMLAFTAGFLVSIPLVLLYLRDFLKNKYMRYMIFVTVIYILTLIVRNYFSYKKHGYAVAVTSRYLLPVMPFYFYLVAMSARQLVGKSKLIGIIGIVCFLAIFTQGGGFTSYSTQSQERLYYKLKPVNEFNRDLKDLYRTIIYEGGIPPELRY